MLQFDPQRTMLILLANTFVLATAFVSSIESPSASASPSAQTSGGEGVQVDGGAGVGVGGDGDRRRGRGGRFGRNVRRVVPSMERPPGRRRAGLGESHLW
jgi:hypothetical protein